MSSDQITIKNQNVKVAHNPDTHYVSVNELYVSILNLINYAESTTWTRFYNFLMGNSILILAWATIYISSSKPPMARSVIIAICLIGFFSGIFWAALGYRGRKILDKYIEIGKNVESNLDLWPSYLDNFKLATEMKKIRDDRNKALFKWSGSYFLLPFGPLVFSILYVILLIASCMT